MTAVEAKVEESAVTTTSEPVGKEKKWNKDFKPLSLDDYLDSDPVDNHGDASFTGVWRAAEKLADYFEEKESDLFPPGSDLDILELGAGTGWLGVTMARNLEGRIRNHVLVDNGNTGAAQWTERNVEYARKEGILAAEYPMQVLPLGWSNAEQIEHLAKLHSWDYIVGSDLIYDEDGTKALSKCTAQLLEGNPKARLIYAHTQGRIPPLDKLWQLKLNEDGLQCDFLASFRLWEERTVIVMDIKRKRRQSIVGNK